MKKINCFHFIFLILNFSFLIFNSVSAQYTQNYEASFNGTNSYIATPWHSEINPASGITLEAWIMPTALPANSAAIIGKNYLTSYYFGIENSGRIVIIPKGGSSFLRSRVAGIVKVNQWSHIAATYDGTTTRLYINGLLDTSTTSITGAVGTNFDSLYIGCDRQSGTRAYFFNGRMNNVRIWSTARTAAEILSHMYIPLNLYQQEGRYNYIAASYQLDNSTADYSGAAENFGFARNISYVNFTDKSINNTDINNNLVFNGTTDYCSIYNFGDAFDATNALTLECWVKRDTTGTQPSVQNLINKSGSTTRWNYGLVLYPSGQLLFAINSGSFILQTATGIISNGQWTHVAATYNSLTGKAVIFVNGDTSASTTFSGNPAIQNNNDTLCFAGIAATSYSANKFKGQLDEIRIWKTVRTRQQIRDNMYKHSDAPLIDSVLCFDFDHIQSGFIYGANTYTAIMKMLGSTYINSSHSTSTKSSSPMLSVPSADFYSSYTLSFRRFFVPDANASGITDSIFISGGPPVNNLKMFLLMNHSYTADLTLTLTSPSGTTINLLVNKGGNANDIMTLFSDDADSSGSPGFVTFNGPGINPPFSPSIKPDQPLSSFNGQSRAGWWKLKCVDGAGADIGYVSGWGLNLLPQKTLSLTALIQGFYNNATDKMIKDTTTIILRFPLSPYPPFDSAKAILDSNGKANFYFTKALNASAYYIVLKHRNLIQTWSSAFNFFTNDTLSYDFTTSLSKAYGNNLVQVDSLPVKFAAFNGDENQDGLVDVTDIVDVYNDVLILNSGYLKTDMNGDDFIDAADLILTYNNSLNLVGVVSP